MTYEVITASGSKYYVNPTEGWWRYGLWGKESLWSFMHNRVEHELELPWNNRDHWENVDKPEVGKLMYLASRDYWRISTAVVEVRQVM